MDVTGVVVANSEDERRPNPVAALAEASQAWESLTSFRPIPVRQPRRSLA